MLTAEPPALDRLLQFLQGADRLKVNFTAKIGDGKEQPAAGTIAWDRPDQMLFRVRFEGNSYTFAVGKKRTIEIDGASHRYVESAAFGQVAPPVGMLSGLPDFTFPHILLSQSKGDLAPGRFGYRANGTALLSNVQTDRITGDTGRGKIDLFIDRAGRLIRYVAMQDTGEGPTRVTFDFTHYEVNGKLPPDLFSPAIPAGFDAAMLPREVAPIQSGEQFPGGWKRVGTGAGEPWSGVERTLIVFVAGQDPPAAHAAVSLKALAAKVRLAYLSADPKGAVPSGYPPAATYVDPKGDAYSKLRAPGTPMFFLTDTGGRVIRLWFGFDRAKRAQFEQEVLGAAAATRK